MKTQRTFTTHRMAALAAGLLGAAPLAAQDRADSGTTWPSRLSVTVHAAQFSPAGNSEAFELFDRALSRGTDALTPRLSGGAVRVRVWKQFSVVGSLEAGDRAIRTSSLVRPSTVTSSVEQQTQLDFSSVQTIGVQWQAWRWTRGAQRTERVRLLAGAGAGQVRYALRQWGSFVDASRLVVFNDDFASKGRGTIGYLSASAEVPVTRWAAVQLDARRQFGSATMNGDYSTFDALDLSGARFGVGLTFSPWR